MNIKIKEIRLLNFMGIRERSVTFSDYTDIQGDNAEGKSTMQDAFMWLLFGKNTRGEAQFEIKTLDSNNNAIPKLEHKVEGVFEIDGKEVVFTKIYKEIWTTKRGASEQVFTGHTTEYLIDGVPYKAGDYQDEIVSIAEENIFKMLTDPLYFSSKLDWRQRRNILSELSGDITQEYILSSDNKLAVIASDLEDKSLDDLKKSINYAYKKLVEEKEDIPVKIRTLEDSIKPVDVENAKANIESYSLKIEQKEAEIVDLSKRDEEELAKHQELLNLKKEAQALKAEILSRKIDPASEIRANIRAIEDDIKNLDLDIKTKKSRQEKLENRIGDIDKKLDDLREEFKNLSSKQFKYEGQTVCPTCNRPLDDDVIEEDKKELESRFNQDKADRLAKVNERGKGYKEEKENLLKEIESATLELETFENDRELKKKEYEALLGDLKDVKTMPDEEVLEGNKEYREILGRIEDKEKEEISTVDTDKVEAIKKSLSEYKEKIKDYEREVYQDSINIETKDKISKLDIDEKEILKTMAKLEEKKKAIELYISKEAELIEEAVNKKFNSHNLRFRLFKSQINGGLEECCDVLINGVPFLGANTAAQVLIGVDIINTLTNIYDIQAPIWIDNKESITEDIKSNSQVITLTKVAGKKFTVMGGN